jgi:hypothetical protein
MRTIGIVISTICLAAAAFSPRLAAAQPGAPQGASVDDKDVINAAKFAIDAEQMALQGTGCTAELTLVKIVSAKRQVVAGINFLLTLDVKEGSMQKTAEAKVWWQAWRKVPYQLSSWKFTDENAAPDPKPEAVNPAPGWGSYEFVFLGKLDEVTAGPVGQSFPPVYSHTLKFTVEKVLRGNLKVGEKVTFANIARQSNPPVFPEGKLCLVGGEVTHSGRTIRRIEEANEANIAAATAECRLPLGWTIADGKAVSPWANLGADAWPKSAGDLGAKTVCSVTGRPALFCGDGVEFTVATVPPKTSIKYTNPDGDGEYRLTVTNKTDKPLQVPALLSDGKDILWDNSVVIRCQGTTYTLPGFRKGLSKLEPVTLQPGQSVSGVVNVLSIEGPQWPQGGYRIGFQFCLGEKSVSHEFYYMTKHHGKIREEMKAAATAKTSSAERN